MTLHSSIPDLRILKLELTAEYATGAAECKDLALINMEAFLRYVEPFVPAHLWTEYKRTCEDVRFALEVRAA